MIGYHIAAIALGFVLDLLFGDPHWLPHPVRLIGRWISFLEGRLLGEGMHAGEERRTVRRGGCLVALVLLPSCALPAALLFAACRVHPALLVPVEGWMSYRLLALRCLREESGSVQRALAAGDLPGARRAVSMIVGRDTARLDAAGVVRAAVETVAENTSDGVIAPLLWLAAGGAAGGFFYKAVNTMDSMVGYRNERYLFFGRAAARLDDAVNIVPSRLSALLMIAAAFLMGGEYDGKNAWRIWRRDRRCHASPNSAQTEAAAAGALGIRLAGDASYFGKTVKKPWIGDDRRQAEPEDIRRAGRLLYATAFLGLALCEGALGIVWMLL